MTPLTVPEILERPARRHQVGRLGDHLEHVVVLRDVERAGIDRRHQVVLVVPRGIHDDHALLVEQIRHRSRLAQAPAVLGEQVPHLGAGAVAVVGDRLDQQRHASRPVALVQDRLDLLGVDAFARPLRDRPLDVVLGHRGVSRLLNGERQRGVAVGVASAFAGGDRDRAGQLGELLAAAGVDHRLFVLDRVPLRMSGHRS